MKINGLPQTEPFRLKEEILDKDPSAALPANMTMEWLQLIERDIDVVLDAECCDQETWVLCSAGTISLVLQLLSGKLGAKVDVRDITWDEMLSTLKIYQVEIAIELKSRLQGLEIEPASLDTIFTNREVTFNNLIFPGALQ